MKCPLQHYDQRCPPAYTKIGKTLRIIDGVEHQAVLNLKTKLVRWEVRTRPDELVKKIDTLLDALKGVSLALTGGKNVIKS